MTKQQMIDNYYERKQKIKELEKGTDHELSLDELAKKIKAECSSGTYNDKMVSLVPVASSPYLTHDEVKAGVTGAIWEKIKPFVKFRKASLNLSIVKSEVVEEIKNYPRRSFKIDIRELHREAPKVNQEEIDSMIEGSNK